MLVRANLNELVDRAEQPEVMIKQVIRDMDNQLLQLKTQLAIALADHHLLTRKRQEAETRDGEWRRKAELALAKGQEETARAALERCLTQQQVAYSFKEQEADQEQQVSLLRTALGRLEQKLVEARAQAELLMTRQRRAKVLNQAAVARAAVDTALPGSTFERMRQKVMREEAHAQANQELAPAPLEDKLAAMEKEDAIDQLLTEIKRQKRLTEGG